MFNPMSSRSLHESRSAAGTGGNPIPGYNADGAVWLKLHQRRFLDLINAMLTECRRSVLLVEPLTTQGAWPPVPVRRENCRGWLEELADK
jgi:hypothetical protein